jgi:hypothetical protein
MCVRAGRGGGGRVYRTAPPQSRHSPQRANTGTGPGRCRGARFRCSAHTHPDCSCVCACATPPPPARPPAKSRNSISGPSHPLTGLRGCAQGGPSGAIVACGNDALVAHEDRAHTPLHAIGAAGSQACHHHKVVVPPRPHALWVEQPQRIHMGGQGVQAVGGVGHRHVCQHHRSTHAIPHRTPLGQRQAGKRLGASVLGAVAKCIVRRDKRLQRAGRRGAIPTAQGGRGEWGRSGVRSTATRSNLACARRKRTRTGASTATSKKKGRTRRRATVPLSSTGHTTKCSVQRGVTVSSTSSTVIARPLPSPSLVAPAAAGRPVRRCSD